MVDRAPGGGSGVVPARIPAADHDSAREALREFGAVVLTGLGGSADAPVVAAALLHGQRLRELFPLRLRRSCDAEPVHLHADGLDLVVDAGGARQRRRHPDEDTVVLQCVRPPVSGGDSFVADAYRFVDRCASEDPELSEFLVETDVDLYGAWAGLRGLPAIPRVARHVEWTRAGRRLVRRGDGMIPLHRDPAGEWVEAMLRRMAEAVRRLEDSLPRFPLYRNDILLLDNYRCWHGRDGHPGERQVRILTARTADA